ncbi:MAG: HAD family phosphatase [Eubacteriales bacterium]|nr:HAD family phosphatase [Eubacteriales bacterium]
MKIKGAIFDLDGTLLDSMHAWDGVGERYLKSKGIQASPTLQDEIGSMSLIESCTYVKKQYNLEEGVDEILAGILKIVESFYFEEALLKEGVGDFINCLHSKGVRMCVATATDKTLAKAALERNKVIEYFDSILTCGELGCNKATAQIYNKALKALGTQKGNTVVFEDAFYAAKSAKRDGFIVCGVYDVSEDKPVKDICDFYINSFLEAGEYFD